jgi:hypothetical protein
MISRIHWLYVYALLLVFKVQFVNVIGRVSVDADKGSEVSQHLVLNRLPNDLLLQLLFVYLLHEVDMVLLLLPIEHVLQRPYPFEVYHSFNEWTLL